MARKNYTVEQIIVILRKVEVLCGQGMTAKEAVKQEGITENTYFRWRKEYGGMSRADVKRLKELEKENSRLGLPPIFGPVSKLVRTIFKRPFAFPLIQA